MLTKGIVEKLIDSYRIKVRIPVYNKPSYVNGATITNDLYEACICTLPNCSMNLQVGDIVILGFEDNDIAQPIILGCLYAKDINDSKTDLVVSSIEALNSVNLPQNTHIGNVTPTDLGYLTGLKSNVQGQIDVLTGTKSGSWVTIIDHVVENDLDTGLYLDIPKIYQKSMTDLRLRYYASFVDSYTGTTETLSMFFGDILDMAWGLVAKDFYPTKSTLTMNTTLELKELDVKGESTGLYATVPEYGGTSTTVLTTGTALIYKSSSTIDFPNPVNSVVENTVITKRYSAGIEQSQGTITNVLTDQTIIIAGPEFDPGVTMVCDVYQAMIDTSYWAGNCQLYHVKSINQDWYDIKVGDILSIGNGLEGLWIDEVSCKWYTGKMRWTMCEANYSLIGKNLIQNSLIKTPLNGSFSKDENYPFMQSQVDTLAYLSLENEFIEQIDISKPDNGKIYAGSQLIVQCKFA